MYIRSKTLELEHNLLNGHKWTNGYWTTISILEVRLQNFREIFYFVIYHYINHEYTA